MRISFDHLRVEYPGHVALAGVSGELPSGSTTAIIGPSGAGKSSLLGVLAGLVRPARGTVRFDEGDVTTRPAEQRRLGVVFQDLRLFDFLSGRDNVGFAPRLQGLSGAQLRARVDEALALVHATAFADRPARVLSGGERQRIALARALAMRPRALLLDEPFAALDADLRRTLREEVRALAQALGLTLVVVTHDREDAFALASRFVVLREGLVEQAGDAETLYRRPRTAFVATLLGEATLLPISERREVLGRAIDLLGDGHNALLRPEDLELASDGDGWPVTVVEARFAGAMFRLVLALPDGHSLVVLAPSVPPSTGLVARPKRAVHTC